MREELPVVVRRKSFPVMGRIQRVTIVERK